MDELTEKIQEAQGGQVAKDALVKVFGDLQDAGVPLECIEGLCDEMTAERVNRPRFDSWVEMAKENGGTDTLLGRLADILGNVKRLKGKLGKVAKAERDYHRVKMPGEGTGDSGLVVTIHCSRGFKMSDVTPPGTTGDNLRYLVALVRRMQDAAKRGVGLGELGDKFTVTVTQPTNPEGGELLHNSPAVVSKRGQESLAARLTRQAKHPVGMPDKRAPSGWR
jgi:hypothetical protein